MKLAPLLLLAVLLFGAKAVQAQPGPERKRVYEIYLKVPRDCPSITTFTEFPIRPKVRLDHRLPFYQHQELEGDSHHRLLRLKLYYYWAGDAWDKNFITKALEDDRPIRLYIRLGKATDYCCYYILRKELPWSCCGDGYGYAGEVRPGTRTLLCFPAPPYDVPNMSWDRIYPTGETGRDRDYDSLPDLRPFLRAVPPEYDDRTSARPYCAPEWRRRAKAGSAKGIRPQYLREADGITTLIPYAPKAAPKPKRRRK